MKETISDTRLLTVKTSAIHSMCLMKNIEKGFVSAVNWYLIPDA